MTHDDALQCAHGYAWGNEDAGGSITWEGAFSFATAYARGWDEFNQEKRGYMIPVSDAYRTWNATHGRTIFAREDAYANQPSPAPR